MRRFILLILSILVGLFIIGCSSQEDIPIPEIPNTMHPSIVVDGELYSSTGEVLPIELDESVVKTVSSVVSGTEMPSKEGEINFPHPDAKYAKITDNVEYVVVMINLEWERFDKRTELWP